MNLDLINIAHASEVESENLKSETVAVTGGEKAVEHESGGLSIDPMIIGFQMFNFLILLLILKAILYKPLVALLTERSAKIKKGVENAEQAEIMLKESTANREKVLKDARAEGHNMVEASRKSGEQVRTDILAKAQEEAQHVIVSGQEAVAAERTKAFQEIRTQAVDLVVKAAEKLLKEKIDLTKDAKLIKDSIESYSN